MILLCIVGVIPLMGVSVLAGFLASINAADPGRKEERGDR